MIKRILSYLVFWILMTAIISTSAVFVVLVYLPFVALKAVAMTATGKAKPKLNQAVVPPGESGTPSGVGE